MEFVANVCQQFEAVSHDTCGWAASSDNKKVNKSRRQVLAKINQAYFKHNHGGSCFLVEYRGTLAGQSLPLQTLFDNLH